MFAAIPAAPSRADSIRNHEWLLRALDLDRAHKYSDGLGVVVAVIDSGVDKTHPDLEGNVLDGVDFTSSKHPDGYGTGSTDVDGHGTGMAGLIAGHGHGAHNSEGIIGIAPQARILPERDGAADTNIDPIRTAASVDWATTHGATVICIAQGGPERTDAMASAIATAEAKNIVVVAAVGNVPDAAFVQYPAAYPGVLAAAGTNESGKHAAVSVTGPGVVLSAPATNIYSDGLNHAYLVGTGTSNSTAIIAGAAALVRSRFPKLSAVEVIHRLTATATDEGPPGRDDEYGYGELNIVAALTAKVPPLSASPSPTEIARPSPAQTTTTTATIAKSSGTSRPPWLPIIGVLIAAIAALAFWTSARRRRR